MKVLLFDMESMLKWYLLSRFYALIVVGPFLFEIVTLIALENECSKLLFTDISIVRFLLTSANTAEGCNVLLL
jgi:hypothetical protein